MCAGMNRNTPAIGEHLARRAGPNPSYLANPWMLASGGAYELDQAYHKEEESCQEQGRLGSDSTEAETLVLSA